jgi:hypothetical protein
MDQLRRGPELALEARDRLRGLFAEQLERDVDLARAIECHEHLAHAPAAQLARQVEASRQLGARIHAPSLGRHRRRLRHAAQDLLERFVGLVDHAGARGAESGRIGCPRMNDAGMIPSLAPKPQDLTTILQISDHICLRRSPHDQRSL